mmetsp:Transcript_31902/g.46980  ORF Transcript_31902/g.46980 Transcript_31902/m.46980 type:complete len:113 (+) Transcript_31902:83-421(+)
MADSPAPKLDFINASETSITVSFTPLSSSDVASYELCWKQYEQTWEEMESIPVYPATSGKTNATAQDLNPCTTYALRLVVVDADGSMGEPGTELILDTDAVDCGPKGKCTIS